MDRWYKKVAVVTGAASGIGACIATKLAKNGMVVIGIDINIEKLQELIKNIGKVSGSLHAKQLDISKSERIPILFNEIKKEFGGVDVLVNCAGIVRAKYFLHESPTKDIIDVLNVNVAALVIFSREAIADMKERKKPGHIFNFNSILGHRNILSKELKLGCYAASKHAVNVIHETIRYELGQEDSDIRVTSISPGSVKTSFYATGGGHLDPIVLEKYSLEPESIANALIYVLGLPQDVLIQELTIKNTNDKF